MRLSDTVTMASTFQVLSFSVGGTLCALRRSEVRELLPVPSLWKPPVTPRALAGFFNLAGQAVPVIRLGALFGIPFEGDKPDIYNHLMLIERVAGGTPGALLVDRVRDILDISRESVSSVAEAETLNGCVEAEIRTSEGFIHLLSLQRILTAHERESLAELGRQAQDRLSEWSVEA
jgi:purine-binding chemotaxis protein CheW